MSSIGFISHHLFVSAAGHEVREPKPLWNRDVPPAESATWERTEPRQVLEQERRLPSQSVHSQRLSAVRAGL